MIGVDPYPIRYVADVLFEAETPLFVGSGESGLVKDALVMTDAFGFPCIPGSSLCGVVRHALEGPLSGSDEVMRQTWKALFGYQKNKEGRGSRVRFSTAYLVLEDDVASLDNWSDYEQKYLHWFIDLPIRHHVRINHRGVADDKGLFTNEIVYKGCRFVCEIVLEGDEQDEAHWNRIIDILRSSTFRVGRGTRNGYGRLKVIQCRTHRWDLREASGFEQYLQHDTRFVRVHERTQPAHDTHPEPNRHISDGHHYELILKLDSFFLFGAGVGDDEVDAIPVTEMVVRYEHQNGHVISFSQKEKWLFIPGSSIKGAIRHRTCYHYNLRKKRHAEVFAGTKLEQIVVDSFNRAVYTLFGAESGWGEGEDLKHDGHLDDKADDRGGRRGLVLVDDLFVRRVEQGALVKIDHVSIDCFTGGAVDGALYSEKVAHMMDLPEEQICLHVHLLPFNQEYDSACILSAFEEALKDICRGVLPLGGMTTKGHGIFSGVLKKDGQIIYPEADSGNPLRDCD